MPAPSTVTLLTMMWPGMLYVPGGIQTVPPAPAAVIAALNALVESSTPVGSAPSLTTDTEPAGWAQRRGDVLEVGEVDRVRGRGVLRVDLQLERGARRIGGGEQPVHLVVEVVRVAAARRVDERVAAVVPAVRVGQGEVGLLGAVDVQRQRGGVHRPVGGVRDAVPEVDGVGRHRGGEGDGLAGAVAREGDGLAAGRLVGELALGVARADDRCRWWRSSRPGLRCRAGSRRCRRWRSRRRRAWRRAPRRRPGRPSRA